MSETKRTNDNLDAALAKTEHVREWVRSMEAEEPSLAWRSALNERLIASTPRRRPLFDWKWASGLAAGAAMAALAFALYIPRPGPEPAASAYALEEAMLASYQQSSSAVTLGQSRLQPEASNGQSLEIEWTEADLGS